MQKSESGYVTELRRDKEELAEELKLARARLDELQASSNDAIADLNKRNYIQPASATLAVNTSEGVL